MNEHDVEDESNEVEEIYGDAVTLGREDLSAMMFGTYQDSPVLNVMNKPNPFADL